MHGFSAWILLFAFAFGIPCFASVDSDPNAFEFYTIDEQPMPAQSMAPTAWVSLHLKDVAVSLLHWALHHAPLPTASEPYNRTVHFGHWINDPTDGTCYNTRTKVLIRDSAALVTFRPNNHCIVDRGLWNEPYTGQQLSDSRQIQIDHMVPLKHAYISGAWEWDGRTRCLYANFMGNSFHLISASGTENMRKSDRGPDGYLPPNVDYRCQYLENWLKIKLIWRLRMALSEVAAIHDQILQNHCSPDRFVFSEAELRNQRAAIYSQPQLCQPRP